MRGLAQRADHVGAETGPMAVAGNNDRHLHIAKAAHHLEGFLILGEIDDAVIHALALKRAIGCVALYAGRLAVNGNGHRDTPFCFLRLKGSDTGRKIRRARNDGCRAAFSLALLRCPRCG